MHSDSVDSHIGRLLHGYCLQECLGSGTLTMVYRAVSPERWQMPEVLITLFLLPETFSTLARERFISRFLQKAERVVQLHHTCILPLLGYGVQDGYPYLVIPHAPGVTLSAQLQHSARLSPTDAFRLLVPISTALSYIHSQGLIYQFLDPTCILLRDDALPQITRLQYAQMVCMREEDESAPIHGHLHLKSIAGSYIGNPSYLAPEMMKGARVDLRCDVYSLGIMLFQLLSGQMPFQSTNYLETAHLHMQQPLPLLHELVPDLPIALELVVNRALHRNPEQRFQTTEALMTAYAQVINERFDLPGWSSGISTAERIRALPMPAPLAPCTYSTCMHEWMDDIWLNDGLAPIYQQRVDEIRKTLDNSLLLPDIRPLQKRNMYEDNVPLILQEEETSIVEEQRHTGALAQEDLAAVMEQIQRLKQNIHIIH